MYSYRKRNSPLSWDPEWAAGQREQDNVKTQGSSTYEYFVSIWASFISCSDYGLLWCDTIQSGRYVPMFQGICCFHLQGRRLNIKAADSSKMLVPIYQTVWCHIAEDCGFNNHYC
jgi:hypothetical protein